jgi:hypothetical protein
MIKGAVENMGISLKHCVKQELDIAIRVGKKSASAKHAYTRFRLILQAYDCLLLKGTPGISGVRTGAGLLPPIRKNCLCPDRGNEWRSRSGLRKSIFPK